ncbi:hypothetical protein [Kitasatospora sp. DSM 101779]|uniref:hypothetical protein n=1 Tax=Kitasatospora sp. DSM 101779 TaxID=2853165 RepID=UPI0021D8959E|nr:hypothetical protein [Kitasatospora sp. DSM 101779]MCU7826408.1 hypothetical protein [Kitasatospora sp. DSM 101779]
MALTYDELRHLSREVGFEEGEVDVAAAVAMAESTGRPEAVGDESLADATWGPSIGLFQIRSLRHPQQFGFPDNLRVETSLRGPTYNAKVARAIQTQAHGWSPWSTYTSGRYRDFLPNGNSAVARPATSRLRRCLDLLLGEAGYKEGPHNHNKYAQELIDAGKVPAGWQNQEWCYVFQSWGTWRAGLEEYCLLSAFCPDGVKYYRRKGWWSEFPMIGAEVFYGAAGERWGPGGSHIERVHRFDHEHIWTIGGNTNLTGASNGDGVYKRGPIRRREVRVYGYGCPPFPEGRLSADPRWGGLASASYTDLPPAASDPDGRDPRPWVYLGQLENAIAADVLAPTGHRSYSWEQVLLVENALVGEGLLDARWADGSWGTLTLRAYAEWQELCGFAGAEADGHPDLESMRKLADKYEFQVGN